MLNADEHVILPTIAEAIHSIISHALCRLSWKPIFKVIMISHVEIRFNDNRQSNNFVETINRPPGMTIGQISSARTYQIRQQQNHDAVGQTETITQKASSVIPTSLNQNRDLGRIRYAAYNKPAGEVASSTRTESNIFQ